nr:hypothetical protein [Tanacetum cinerariifolium]
GIAWSCEHCNAWFWYGEQLKGYYKDQKIIPIRYVPDDLIVVRIDQSRWPNGVKKDLLGVTDRLRTSLTQSPVTTVVCPPDPKIRIYAVGMKKKVVDEFPFCVHLVIGRKRMFPVRRLSNKMLLCAGAYRLQTGMRGAFGKPQGSKRASECESSIFYVGFPGSKRASECESSIFYVGFPVGPSSAAGTYAGDGSRKPTELEFQQAFLPRRHHGQLSLGHVLLKTNNTITLTKTAVSLRADKPVATLDEIMTALKSGQSAIVDMVTRLPLFSESVRAPR